MDDNDHIIKYSKWAGESINKYGISSSHVRMKMWILHSKIIKSFCRKSNFNFVEVPDGLKKSNGFLSEMAYKDDFFHANDWYGDFLLNFIDLNI